MNFAIVWWASLAVKILIGVTTPLANDESYYWAWSQNLQWSYFDHPPMVAWLMLLGQPFLFLESAVRIPAIFLGHCSLLFWKPLIEKYAGADKVLPFTFLWLACPLTGVGSILVTPDLPLLFFWSASIWAIERALTQPSVRAYAILGALVGLTFCAKYNAVLIAPIIAVGLFKSWWMHQKRWQLMVVLILAGLVTSSPVWGWNAANDWISFKFQLNHGFDSPRWRWNYPLDYIAAQVGLLFPPILYWVFRRQKGLPVFIYAAAAVPFLFFLQSSFHARVEANWPAVAYPAVFLIAVSQKMPAWVHRAYLSVSIVLLVLVISQVHYPWLPLKPNSTKLAEFTRYDVLLLLAERPDFFACSYQMAADLSFKLKRPIYKLQGINRRDFYDFLPESKPTSQRFFLAHDTDDELPAWLRSEGYQVIRRDVVTERIALLEIAKP